MGRDGRTDTGVCRLEADTRRENVDEGPVEGGGSGGDEPGEDVAAGIMR